MGGGGKRSKGRRFFINGNHRVGFDFQYANVHPSLDEPARRWENFLNYLISSTLFLYFTSPLPPRKFYLKYLMCKLRTPNAT